MDSVAPEPIPDVCNFEYTGAVQSLTFPAGTYKLEVWGAQGGSYDTTYVGGNGGYSVGELTFNATTTLYIYVGGQGAGSSSSGAKTGGFNGGGSGYSSIIDYACQAGGGASDIRIGTDSLYARVIVAGGGGGQGTYTASSKCYGGTGGGTSGNAGSRGNYRYKAGTGGTQTTAGASYYGMNSGSSTYGNLANFGVGGSAKEGNTSYQIAGGGGGWYGGGYAQRAGAGGGSGYVYTSSSASNYPSGCLLNSSYYLSNASTTAGNASMPKTDGSGNETGHSGNGYARITKL